MSQRSAEDVFVDYCGRRRGILRALTSEVDKFYNQCTPEQENLCLYGYNDGTWAVTLPCEEIPPELPEPALGINFARNGMKREDWLSLVSVHSDSWLMAIAFFNAARLDAEGRRQLFNDINSLPTCYEIIGGRSATKPKGMPLAQISKRALEGVPLATNKPPKRKRAQLKDEDEESNEPCPNCGKKYITGEFWIACDYCNKWYDGACVNMTEEKADQSTHWKCPKCLTGRK